MNTPTLTKQQQKHSLSAKKAPAKGLRNVLAQPQDSFWPVIKGDESSQLEGLLKKLMPAIRRPSHVIPWSQLRQLKKEERIKAKKEAVQKEGNIPNTQTINSIVLGLNAITRALEKNSVCCVLIDASIEPHLLIKHIIIMAQNKKIPILLLFNFKVVTLNSIGFASAACALKNVVMKSSEHHFHPLYTKVCDIFKDIPLPKNSLKLFKDVETVEEIALCEKDKMNFAREPEIKSSESIKFTLSTNVYKYRSTRNERAFVPPSATASSINGSTTEKIEPCDFISLSNSDTDEYVVNIKKNARYINIRKDSDAWKQKNFEHNNQSSNITYLPLRVKRLQGNSNRLKATKVSKQKKK
ncbi:hypothetical protein WN55_00850 [Dufourea novaeangliae]|uniref:Ribosomal protein eL8/eL30/eS12/Gadd45 domain-containing protein n=2 Tax=Dufourea novaeangliae TaxID=178035 RepID=A0A154PCU3_DUFNO|nr:hypothetical protein WN55_00850 [Dufourea novaeangliae]